MTGERSCGVAHMRKFVDCCMGVVYKIPLSCTRAYIVQTGRCLNERLKEHRALCEQKTISGNLSSHCFDCKSAPAVKCAPAFNYTEVLFKSNDEITREIWEAFCMTSGIEGECVSSPSIILLEKAKEDLRYK